MGCVQVTQEDTESPSPRTQASSSQFTVSFLSETQTSPLKLEFWGGVMMLSREKLFCTQRLGVGSGACCPDLYPSSALT